MINIKNEEDALNYIGKIRINFEAIGVYREIVKGPVLKKLYELFKHMDKKTGDINGFITRYCEFYYELINNNCKSLTDYIIDQVLYADNSFTRLSESKGVASSYVIETSSNDLKHLSEIARILALDLKEAGIKLYSPTSYQKTIIKELGEWKAGSTRCRELSRFPELECIFDETFDWGSKLRELQSWHVHRGSGAFARFRGFIWQRVQDDIGLEGIAFPDQVRLEDLIGYEQERRLIIENTKCFLKGLPANNVLLYGDRGTGKSATIKALLNEYFEFGLRIIELPKDNMTDLPLIIRQIKTRAQKFIIFIDDLAFGDNEDSYTALKAVLEGGLESRASNIVIYATSNRRHLIKEKFSDRIGLMSDNLEDEISAADTIQEKLSLADRFGITITFSSPDKERYLKIVEGLADRRGLNIDRETLFAEAMKWELRYNGRSPRTAKQFVDYLEGKLRFEAED